MSLLNLKNNLQIAGFKNSIYEKFAVFIQFFEGFYVFFPDFGFDKSIFNVSYENCNLNNG
jgi:hypothetical protein